MPQLQLPIFHEGVSLITPDLGYERRDDQIVYLHGAMPVFVHKVDDLQSFKMIVSQFYVTGNAKQAEIVRAFGINALSLKRWVKKYRETGPGGFYEVRRRGARKKKDS
jgi:hypothetical protein